LVSESFIINLGIKQGNIRRVVAAIPWKGKQISLVMKGGWEGRRKGPKSGG